MKTKKVWSGLIGAVLSFGAAFAGVGCLVSAFEFGVDMKTMAAVIFLCAVVAAVCFSVKFGALLLAGIGALLFGYLSRQGEFFLEFEALVYRISRHYHGGYGWPVAQWSEGANLDTVPVEGGLLLVAGMVVILLCRMLCRQKRAMVPVAVSLMPLFACCVVTDTVPGEQYLFLLLAVVAIILLTQAVRRENGVQSQRLTAMLLIPVTLASALLSCLAPQEEYVHQDWQQYLVNFFNKTLEISGNPQQGENPDISVSIDLSAVGKEVKYTHGVMDVVSDRTETLYLRGQAYDVYDGLGWHVSEYVDQNGAYWPTEQVVPAGTVTIETRITNSIKYFPYYPSGTGWLNDFDQGAMVNPDGERTYSFDRVEAGTYSAVSSELLQQCKDLPESTRQAAEKILEGIWESQEIHTDSQKIAMIEEYVRSSASYSLDTAKMPQEETDFAIWFLEDSETGYCVHFATAAVVLLRAAGIPARYVTGYMADVTAGVKTRVVAAMSHAWVEYQNPDSGCWTVLDATPSNEVLTPTEPSDAPTTEPTASGESSEPTAEPTIPSDATAPVTMPPRPTETTEPATESPIDPTGDVGIGSGTGGRADYSWRWNILKWVAIAVAALAVAAIQYLLRLRIRRKRLYTGPNNQQALRRWRYAQWVGWYMRRKPPERLKELAEKAKFSQHTLTPQELAEFDAWLQKMRKTVQDKPSLQRMLIKLIFGAE